MLIPGVKPNQIGVDCFDLDVVGTADGYKIVGHPVRLADAARLVSTSAILSLEARTLLELRSSGADSIGFVIRRYFWLFID